MLTTLKRGHILLAFIGAVLFPIFAFAHGEGSSFEAQEGDYLIDIGYTPSEFVVGSQVRFDFNVYPKDTNVEIDSFTDVWVRITSADEKLLYAGSVHNPNFGPTGFTLSLPEAGNYTLSVRFQNEGEALVESSFGFVVKEAETEFSIGSLMTPQVLILLLLGIAVGALGTFGMVRSKNIKYEEATSL